MAPARGAEPQGAGQADGVPRDHPRGDPARDRQPPRPRPPARRRAGGAADLRSALRLRGQPGPLEEDPAWAVRGPRPVRGDPHRRRAGARAHGVRLRVVLGPRRDVRSSPAPEQDQTPFSGTLVEVDGTRVASGRDFDERASSAATTWSCSTRPTRWRCATVWSTVRSWCARSNDKPYTRRPYAPFITSSLQVEAGRKLRFSSSQTMSLAQSLYQNGYITYMRTDSTTLSDDGAHRGAFADPREVRPAVPPRRSPPVHEEGQERPGGPRGDPAGR